MADEKRISDLITAPSFDDGALSEISMPDQAAESGYSTYKITEAERALKIANTYQYQNALSTTNKTICGAINEVLAQAGGGVTLTGTLTAGQTTITLSSMAITANSTLDFYTDVFGINPTSVSVSTGSVTLTFESQATDINVKVRVW